jgi:hypothetical protein
LGSGAVASLATHLWGFPLPEALNSPSEPQELLQLQKEVQSLHKRLAGIPPIPSTPQISGYQYCPYDVYAV